LLQDPEQRRNLNVQNGKGETPLYVAVKARNLDGIMALLECGEIDVNLPNNEGLTPLHVAVTLDFVAAVEQLIAHPLIDVNVRGGSFADTPLHMAVRKRNSEIVNLLLRFRGIDVSVENRNNTIPEDLARELAFEEIWVLFP
jgi:ankyrin repeat protein